MSDGTVFWRQKIEGSVDSQPLIMNGVVYVNSLVGENGPDYAYALRANDGSVLWSYTSSGLAYASSDAENSVIYIASPEGVSALQAVSGSILWHYVTPGIGDDSPVVVNVVVYASELNESNATGSNCGDIYALQSSTGGIICHDTVAQASPFDAQLAHGVIYRSASIVDAGNSALYALRSSDCSLLWNYPVAASSVNAPVLDGAALYTGAENGMLYALRASSGAVLWHYQTDVGL